MENELPMITLLGSNLERPRKRRRRMASRRTDSPHLGSESSPSNAARVKRFHSKSRRGCLTCRQRRVKCDEQRSPNCARCDKGGYICEWQDTRTGRSRLAEDKATASSTRSQSLATTHSEDDGPAHRFFSDGVVQLVATLFTDMANSFITDQRKAQLVSAEISIFYYQHVYYASQSSTMIRKTLTAICGLYQRAFESSRGSSPRDHTYITQYSEAVTDLRTSSRELGPDIVLIASILFANYEYLMGDLCSAFWHLRAGSKILNEHSNISPEHLSAALSQSLSTIFDAFDHGELESEADTPGSDYLESVKDNQFEDLHQANDNLLSMYSHTFALQTLSKQHPRHTSQTAQSFQRWSGTWKSRMRGLQGTLETESMPWLQLLNGQHCALNFVVGDILTAIEPAASDIEQMDDLVLQVSSFADSCSEFIEHADQPERPFKENVGLILPLVLVVLRSPDINTCEAALGLLGRLRVVEAGWNSCLAHAVARSILHARQVMRFQSDESTFAASDAIPVADVKKALVLNSGTELDLTITFPKLRYAFGQSESNMIIGNYCLNAEGQGEEVCAILEHGGYQGPVTIQRLQGCTGHDST